MSALLRFIGVANVVVWFGGSLFFVLAIAPTFTTPEVRRVFGEAYAGVLGQKLMERFYLLQGWCGLIAVAHQLAEWVYLGRRLPRLALCVLGAILAIGLAGGVWLQPKLRKLHQVAHCVELHRQELWARAERERAARSLRLWRLVSQSVHGVALVGLAYVTWQVMNPPDPTRFIATPPRFRR